MTTEGPARGPIRSRTQTGGYTHIESRIPRKYVQGDLTTGSHVLVYRSPLSTRRTSSADSSLSEGQTAQLICDRKKKMGEVQARPYILVVEAQKPTVKCAYRHGTPARDLQRSRVFRFLLSLIGLHTIDVCPRSPTREPRNNVAVCMETPKANFSGSRLLPSSAEDLVKAASAGTREGPPD